MGCGANKENVTTNNIVVEGEDEVNEPAHASEEDIIEELSAKSEVSEDAEKEDELLDKLIASSPGISPTSTTMTLPQSKDQQSEEIDITSTIAATPEPIVQKPQMSPSVILDAKGASDFDFSDLETKVKGVELPPILPRQDFIKTTPKIANTELLYKQAQPIIQEKEDQSKNRSQILDEVLAELDL